MTNTESLSTATRNLREDITYWAVIGDGFGGYIFKGPFFLKGRWEQKQQLIWTAKGEEEVSAAQVYLSGDVEIGGYIFRGKSATVDPTTLPTAWIVRQFNRVPALSGTRMQRKAFL